MDSQDEITQLHEAAAIVVFAKCPIPGSSKTRLAGLLGEHGSAMMAEAMLSDVILSLSHDRRLCSVRKILVYAPGNKNGEEHMIKILKRLCISSDNAKSTGRDDDSIGELDDLASLWTLLPMASTDSNKEQSKNLLSSDLGSKLSDALSRVRLMCVSNEEEISNRGETNKIEAKSYVNFGPVVFLGMDSPELPIDEIFGAIQIATISKKAYLNPAHDGGYGMLCVPSQAPTCIFKNVRWSTSLTALSQLKALSDNGIDTVIGSLMSDIDETRDVKAFAGRLCQVFSDRKEETHHCEGENCQSSDSDRLSQKSQYEDESIARNNNIEECLQKGMTRNTRRQIKYCQKSLETLLEMGLIRKMDTDDEDDSLYVLNFEN